jgi:hypothetical protein
MGLRNRRRDSARALQRLVAQWESDLSLFDADELCRRMEVLDRLDAYFPDADLPNTDSELIGSELHQRAKAIRGRLEAANSKLYQSIRLEIQLGSCPATFLDLLQQSRSKTGPFGSTRGIGYDYLDELTSGVLQFDEPAGQPVNRGPEIVFYQPTPAHHIFTLITAASISASDVLIDLGSGLGHVALLVSACTGADSIGAELEPSFVASARKCADRLNLSGASFLEKDARDVALSSGTVFYLYTPFIGSILRAVLNLLRKQAAVRPIKICTFGPCTPTVAEEPWLEATMSPEVDQIAVFLSRS